MEKNELSKISNNSILKHYLQKPKFLSKKNEKELLELIKNNNINKFYDKASKIINSTENVTNLYTYLFYKLKQENIENQEIENQMCARLFNRSSIGWLQIKDIEVITFCKNNTTDKILLKDIKKIKSENWSEEYLKYIKIEQQITMSLEKLEAEEKNIIKYFEFVTKLYKSKNISKKKYESITEKLIEETIIYKGKQPIASLISEKTQKHLQFKTIYPKISINKDLNLSLLDNIKKT